MYIWPHQAATRGFARPTTTNKQHGKISTVSQNSIINCSFKWATNTKEIFHTLENSHLARSFNSKILLYQQKNPIDSFFFYDLSSPYPILSMSSPPPFQPIHHLIQTNLHLFRIVFHEKTTRGPLLSTAIYSKFSHFRAFSQPHGSHSNPWPHRYTSCLAMCLPPRPRSLALRVAY